MDVQENNEKPRGNAGQRLIALLSKESMRSTQHLPSWQRSLYALALAQFLGAFAFNAASPLLPLFIQQLGVAEPSKAAFWTGVTQFATGLGAFAVGPLWGALADRFGRRTMVLRALLGGAVMAGLVGLSPNVPVLIVLRTIYGAMTGITAASSALAASQSPSARIAFAIGLVQMAMFLGSMAGPLPGGMVGDALGYRAPFFLAAGVAFMGFLVVLLFVRERFEPPQGKGRHIHPLRNMRVVLTMPKVVPLLGVLMIIYFGPFMVQPIMAVYMQDMVAEGAATFAGLALSVFGLASAVSSLAVARLSRGYSLYLAVLVAAFAAAALYLLQVWLRSPVAAAVLFGAVGLCQGTLLTATSTLLSAAVPREKQGAVFGVAQSVNAFGVGLAALVAGTMTVVLGVRSIFIADTALFIVLGLIVWKILSTEQRRSANTVGAHD